MYILYNFVTRFAMLPSKKPPQAECNFKARRASTKNSEIELSGLACTLGEELYCTTHEADVNSLICNNQDSISPLALSPPDIRYTPDL